MAVEERQLPNSNQWEIKATGEDIPKLAGMLEKTAKDSYREAFHKNEGKYVRISDPHGNPTDVPSAEVDEYRARGYGRVSITPTMVVPELPWPKKLSGPGKHKFRYNKLTKCMEEV